MTNYIAENVETGQTIRGGARTLARHIGVIPCEVQKALKTKEKIKGVWAIKCQNIYGETRDIFEEWDRFTAPYKALSARKRGNKKGNGRIRLRTMYNVGVY